VFVPAIGFQQHFPGSFRAEPKITQAARDLISPAIASLPLDGHVAALDKAPQPGPSALDVDWRIKLDICQRIEVHFLCRFASAVYFGIRITKALEQHGSLLGEVA
jgi:hypothetical protein